MFIPTTFIGLLRTLRNETQVYYKTHILSSLDHFIVALRGRKVAGPCPPPPPPPPPPPHTPLTPSLCTGHPLSVVWCPNLSQVLKKGLVIYNRFYFMNISGIYCTILNQVCSTVKLYSIYCRVHAFRSFSFREPEINFRKF